MTRLRARNTSTGIGQGKGVILITAHFGNVDILVQLPLAYGVPFSAPAAFGLSAVSVHVEVATSHGVRLYPPTGR